MAGKGGSKARAAGRFAGVASRSWSFAKRVDWAAVWVSAQWLAHHSKRLYANLSEAERREFLNLVVPTRDERYLGPAERARVRELVTKAFSGDAPGRQR